MSDLYEIAASGMAAQRTQMDVIAENLANAGVVRADGGVFRPKAAIVQSEATLQLHDAIPFERALQDAGLLSDHDGGFAAADEFEDSAAPAGVSVAGIVEQDLPPQYRLDPGNPFAAKGGSHKGYVAMADVDPIQQMVALVASGRAYDADVSMLQVAKQMDTEAADIDRA